MFLRCFSSPSSMLHSSPTCPSNANPGCFRPATKRAVMRRPRPSITGGRSASANEPPPIPVNTRPGFIRVQSTRALGSSGFNRHALALCLSTRRNRLRCGRSTVPNPQFLDQDSALGCPYAVQCINKCSGGVRRWLSPMHSNSASLANPSWFGAARHMARRTPSAMAVRDRKIMVKPHF